MDLLDILLMLVVLAYAASGYRRGLVAGCVSLAGFVGGAVVGVWILPWVMDLVTPGTTRATVTAVFTVLLPAVVGHELAGRLGLRLRRELDRGPLRVADGVGGAAAVDVLVCVAVVGVVPRPAVGVPHRLADGVECVANQVDEQLREPGALGTVLNLGYIVHQVLHVAAVFAQQQVLLKSCTRFHYFLYMDSKLEI